jgi:hypothetical protein
MLSPPWLPLPRYYSQSHTPGPGTRRVETLSCGKTVRAPARAVSARAAAAAGAAEQPSSITIGNAAACEPMRSESDSAQKDGTAFTLRNTAGPRLHGLGMRGRTAGTDQRNPAPRSPRTARAFSAATSTSPSGLARPTRAPTDTRTVLSRPLSVSASMASV